MKFFNTAGRIDPYEHYFIPHRLDKKELMTLVAQKSYFILRAPRQTGKTTAILEFCRALNRDGKYSVLYANFEPAQAIRNNVNEGMRAILRAMHDEAIDQLPPDDPFFDFFKQPWEPNAYSLKESLSFWARNSKKPTILLIDEIDSLVGDTLITVLRQLRAGYTWRQKSFPQSVCLIGVRDVRDYRIWSEEQKAIVIGGSAFNITSESFRLPDFTKQQVRNLYRQHTKETGQKFTTEAINYAFEQTQGQPWLVNALAYEACFRDVTDRKKPITATVFQKAKETLIRRRDRHFDVLFERLNEPRVQRIIDLIISGSGHSSDINMDDLQYSRDLGLITQDNIEIANPIYQEVIPRWLTYTKHEFLVLKPASYLNKDGSLDMLKLMDGFTQHFIEHAPRWFEMFAYKESGPHLLLLTYLTRIVNGGGSIIPEYALGTNSVDLYVTLKKQRIIVECKVMRGPKTVADGLQQTAKYMRSSRASEGHLVIFDRSNKPLDEKVYHRIEKVGRHSIHVWGL